MRCLALAQCWSDEVGPVTFLGNYSPSLVQRLTAEGFMNGAVPPSLLPAEESDWLTRELPLGGYLVVDGYEFSADYLASIADGERRVLFLDDNRHLDRYDVDVLVNQNSYAPSIDYGPEVGQVLLGPTYSLFRRSLRHAAATSGKANASVERVLVTFGGADPAHVTLPVLEALGGLKSCAAHFDVVVGPLNSQRTEIEAFCRSAGSRFQVHVDPDMASLLSRAQLAVSACGTSALELALFGLPSVTLAIADNQVAAGRALHASAATHWLGPSAQVDPGDLCDALLELMTNTAYRERMARSAAALVDGRGVTRVVAALRSLSLTPLPNR